MPTINGYANGEPIEAVDINQYFLRGNRNKLINGDFRVAQRGTSLVVNDANYGLDRWVMLASGTGGVGSSGVQTSIIQDSDVPTGGYRSLRLGLQAGNNNLKFGCLQIIERSNLTDIRSGTVTLSFKAKGTSRITDVRAAVLAWTGTADSVTRDIITTSGTPWLSTPPTLATSWTYLNTPANLGVTTSWAEYKINATVAGNPNNIAVFIWVNSTETIASSDFLWLTDVQLESGAIATPFERKTYQAELADCQRYFIRFNFANGSPICTAGSWFSNQAFGVLPLHIAMRISPSSVAISSTTALQYLLNGTGYNSTNAVVSGSNVHALELNGTYTSIPSPAGGWYRANGTVWIQAEAEL